MKMRFLSLFITLFSLGLSSTAFAQTAPNGWTNVENGISKNKSKVTIGDVQNLDGMSPSGFIATLENMPPEGSVFISSGGIKDGKYVIQVKRELTIDDVPARSVLMLCKMGKKKIS